MEMKTCSKCKLKKDVSEFHKEKSHSDCLCSWCKECVGKNKKTYYQRNSEKIKAEAIYYRKTFIGHLRVIYNNIKQRCNNPKCKAYKNYGGRGIKCLFESVDEFMDYVINDLQVDPRGLTIDRINNDGHYEKGNIRFVTYSENLKNRRSWTKNE